MKKVFATIIAFVFVIGLGTAHATTIDFESAPDTGSYTSGLFTVGDATFTNWYVVGDSSGSGNHIGVQVSFLNSTASISFLNPVFDLDFDLQFDDTQLYINGDMTTNLFAGTTNYTGTLAGLLGSSLNGISSLTFVAASGSTVIDDITYSATPIPGAAWLLGSGLIGLVGLRRKFMA